MTMHAFIMLVLPFTVVVLSPPNSGLSKFKKWTFIEACLSVTLQWDHLLCFLSGCSIVKLLTLNISWLLIVHCWHVDVAAVCCGCWNVHTNQAVFMQLCSLDFHFHFESSLNCLMNKMDFGNFLMWYDSVCFNRSLALLIISHVFSICYLCLTTTIVHSYVMQGYSKTSCVICRLLLIHAS